MITPRVGKIPTFPIGLKFYIKDITMVKITLTSGPLFIYSREVK